MHLAYRKCKRKISQKYTQNMGNNIHGKKGRFEVNIMQKDIGKFFNHCQPKVLNLCNNIWSFSSTSIEKCRWENVSQFSIRPHGKYAKLQWGKEILYIKSSKFDVRNNIRFIFWKLHILQYTYVIFNVFSAYASLP